MNTEACVATLRQLLEQAVCFVSFRFVSFRFVSFRFAKPQRALGTGWLWFRLPKQTGETSGLGFVLPKRNQPEVLSELVSFYPLDFGSECCPIHKPVSFTNRF
jgi:hypothetical protein